MAMGKGGDGVYKGNTRRNAAKDKNKDDVHSGICYSCSVPTYFERQLKRLPKGNRNLFLIAYTDKRTYYAHVIQTMCIICPLFNTIINPGKEV